MPDYPLGHRNRTSLPVNASSDTGSAESESAGVYKLDSGQLRYLRWTELIPPPTCRGVKGVPEGNEDSAPTQNPWVSSRRSARRCDARATTWVQGHARGPEANWEGSLLFNWSHLNRAGLC